MTPIIIRLKTWLFYFIKLSFLNFIKFFTNIFFGKKYSLSPQIIKSSVGTYICSTIDSVIISNKYFEYILGKKIKEIIKKIKIDNIEPDFVNIGAHLGRYSIEYAKDFKNIYSFEPTPDTYHLLKSNIRLSNINNIKTFNLGLSNKKGKLYFEVNNFAESQNKVVTSPNKHTIEIPVNTFDNIDILHDNIKLFIIDVEGHELNVLRGMKKFIQNNNNFYIVIELLNQKAFSGVKNELVGFTFEQIDPTNYLFYKK